jgi:hypothetical protein
MSCVTQGCKNDNAPNRKLCYKCRSREYAKRQPAMYYYNALRNNARRRDHKFALSFDEFMRFCEETGYMELKGKDPNSASIDRIKPWLGYTYDNIQVLTLAENSRKGNGYPF